MKLTILLLSLTFLLSDMPNNDCANAYSSADDAYSYGKKASDASTWADSKTYLKKALDSFEQAIDYAEECECEEAHTSATDGYSYVTKGYNSKTWDEAKGYAKKATASAGDTMSAANDCSGN